MSTAIQDPIAQGLPLALFPPTRELSHAETPLHTAHRWGTPIMPSLNVRVTHSCCNKPQPAEAGAPSSYIVSQASPP